jgi:hypothetical protein
MLLYYPTYKHDPFLTIPTFTPAPAKSDVPLAYSDVPPAKSDVILDAGVFAWAVQTL